MITEKDTIKCEAVFSEDKVHRLLWKRVWNKDKPIACVISLNPALSDTIVTDTTTSLVVNNIAKLGEFGGVSIVNLFSLLTPKLHMQRARDIDINDLDNDNYIKKAADEASVIILAWGRAGDTNVRIYNRADQVIALLKNHQEKFRVITDGNRVALHPLTPSVRAKWVLVDAKEWLDSRTPLSNKEDTATAKSTEKSNVDT
ncbi:MAG: DUF1643 domain-containing protein [Clostridia bacterium]|nr:DUF1643 domain-containing protein [Clostridia bacterium]